MKKLIVITSGKGGVGKTTTAVNLASALAHFGKDVLIIDANLTTPNVGIHLNSPETPVNLNHVLNGEADLKEAIYLHESGMKVVLASLSMDELRKLKYSNLKKHKKSFLDNAEYVIVDSAAGLGQEAISAIDMADELILVSNPEMPSLVDALKTIKVGEELKKPILGTIMTRVRRNTSELNAESVKDMLEIPVLGMIPEDISIQESLRSKMPVIHSHPSSRAARAYKEIAAKICEVEYDSNIDKESFFKRLKKKVFG